MSGLFKSGPSGKDVANATPFGQLPEFQQKYFQEAIQRGGELGLGDSDIFQPVAYSPEQLAAIGAMRSGVDAPTIGNFNFGQRASSAYDQAGGIMSQFNPTLSTAMSSLRAGQNPITGEQLQAGIADFMNPYTEQVINAGINDLTESADRQRSMMEGRASSNLGAFGGSRMGVESAELQRGLNREIGTLGGNLRSDAFKTASQQALQRLTDERNRALTGGQSGLAALSSISQGANTMSGIGDSLFKARLGMEDLRTGIRDRNVSRLQEMIGAGDILRQFQLEQQQAPITQIDYLRDIATTNPGVAGGQLPQRQSMMQQMGGMEGIGKAATGIGALMMMSDINSKENIKYKRKEKGFNIYEFNYKGSPIRYSGVMAQEVQKVRPDAVGKIGKYLAVDYSKLGLEMEVVNG